MLSSRAVAFSQAALRAQPLRLRAANSLQQTRALRLQASPKMRMPQPVRLVYRHTGFPC